MTLRWPRPTVRLRLTLTYTALFVATGAALLAVNYLLVQHREGGVRTATEIICRGSVKSGTSIRVGGTAPTSVPHSLNPADCPGVVGAVYYHTSVTGSSSGSGAVVSPVLPIQIPGPTATEISQLTATVAASQAHAPRQSPARVVIRAGASRGRGGRHLVVDGGPGAPAGAPHHRRSPAALGGDPVQPDQPARAPTTSSKSSPTHSTPCWAASTGLFEASSGSWPMRRTSYGPPWRPRGYS